MFVAGGAQEICLNISIINDATAENCLESFFVTLVSSDAIVEPLFTIEIGITDDDGMCHQRVCGGGWTGVCVCGLEYMCVYVCVCVCMVLEYVCVCVDWSMCVWGCVCV